MPRNPDLPCADCGKLMWRSTTSLPAGRARCQPCRRKSPGSQSTAHGTPRGRDWHRRRGEPPCEDCRTVWNAVSRERQAAARVRGWKRPPRNKTFNGTCRQCRTPFRAEQEQPYCSRACWGQSQRRPRELVHVGPMPHRRGAAPVVDLTPRRLRVWCSGPCAWCGDHFTIIDQTRARYCSRRCSARAHRAARDDRFRISPRQRMAIYERDAWICQLCLEPVDRDAHYLDDWAPSLDHIEPQSAALIPDHSPKNLRTAHRWCNAVRGDGTYHADLFEGAATYVAA